MAHEEEPLNGAARVLAGDHSSSMVRIAAGAGTRRAAPGRRRAPREARPATAAGRPVEVVDSRDVTVRARPGSWAERTAGPGGPSPSPAPAGGRDGCGPPARRTGSGTPCQDLATQFPSVHGTGTSPPGSAAVRI
ncbi:hypothetical protein ACFW2T_25070 [Streptomyces sp. NPDC058892]|uniref:hypothetical protein n=1 Tax=unclassified Streptomyces TaxID=2593676 RepID=UPI0036BF555C